ncbi:NAD(P)-binding domain-containing protein [uncultured Oceanisphaera sp.]|uniref:NAD(P)-binding domain-containing protein n=1 Tax=uncultured Oceanisphaera sp. TaxID=353858 RepID=UPI002606BC83|nr:NAD(P)-binding domain-containing protein [uncultured Oceanisphaera sp.]
MSTELRTESNGEPNVVIMGLGWLGEPLAKTLHAQGYRVAGTTTSQEKAERLRLEGIKARVWDINAPLPSAWPADLVANTLVLCVPPGKVDDYADTLGRVASLAAGAGVTRLLFTSATSVYGGLGCKTEADAAPDSPRGERMLAAEQAVRHSGIPQVLCLRLSGLVGGSREPGRFLAGRRFDGGEEPVNLVAQEDLLRFIPAILARHDWPDVLNVSAPHHPSRREFYTRAALLRDLPAPLFDGGGEGKQIDGSALSRWLGLEYRVTDWFAWLAARKAQG